MTPAVVLGCHTMGLGVIRALGVSGIPIIAVSYDDKDMGYSSRYVIEHVRAPHPEQHEEEFLETLRQLATRFRGSILFPVSDETLKIASKNKALLGQDYLLACTEWEITERFIDKKITYSLAESIGVPAPHTFVPKSTGDIEEFRPNIRFPYLVKPSQSHRYFQHFGRKMVKVENIDQMMQAFQEAADASLEIMLQELIPGDDSLGVNYNSYFWNGRPIAEFTAQKIRGAPVELGSPCVAMSNQNMEVIALGRQIIQAMGFYGYSCTEFKLDPRDGVYKLMEVNGRHNLSTLLAVNCGLNFPWIHYRHLVEGELPQNCDYQTGVYWIDVFRDLAYSIAYTRNGGALTQFIRPYISSHVFAIMDMNDPRPFVTRCTYFLRKALNVSLKPERNSKQSIRELEANK